MGSWCEWLKYDPLKPLLESGNEAILYYVQRDLLDEQVQSVKQLWGLPEVTRILKKQLDDGSWPRAGEKKHKAINYHLIETWRQFRFLVEKYSLSRENAQAEKAAEFLFSCQTDEGDIRGMLANQYATYYTGAIMSLLIRAGYEDDPRIEKGFQWLLSIRQDDQGWSIPLITHKLDRATIYRLTSRYTEPIEPDRAKPFSHNATGMVLRAFAVHPKFRFSDAALTAAQLLKSRFFQPDRYTSYQSPEYWIRFEYPFWWNNLVAALDSISLIGIPKEDTQIQQALRWLFEHQMESGIWDVSYMSAQKEKKESPKMSEMRLWVTLAICRIVKRFYEI